MTALHLHDLKGCAPAPLAHYRKHTAIEIIARACGGKDALERKLREFEFPKLPDQQSISHDAPA
jgi:hypothetical protein